MTAGSAESRWDGRSRARAAALQVLYECEVGRLSPGEALTILEGAGGPEVPDLTPPERAFALRLVQGVRDTADALDERIGQAARHWRVERMAVLDRQVLRLAVHEWLAIPETPPRVVIDEAIELARTFSGQDAAKFVNGVLDGVYRTLKDEGRVAD